jgi:acyl-CoA reductase-like NAD-dependent aldehyde dehydrogenase
LGERRLVGDFCNTIGPGADIQRVRADLSPLSSEQALIGLLKQVDGAISHGAKVIMGGKRIDPTILTDIKPAIFATRAEAQRAADAHVRDDYRNAETTDDGLSWAVE